MPAFNIASSVTLIMAQRLARKLCDHCKAPEVVRKPSCWSWLHPAATAAGLRLFKPVGCKECSGGYRGRVGIADHADVRQHRQTHHAGANSLQVAAIAQKRMHPALSGLEARLGVTSLAEINRITTN